MPASGDGDSTIKLWRVSDGSLIRTLEELSGEASHVIGFSPDGRLQAWGLADGSIHLWGVLP